MNAPLLAAAIVNAAPPPPQYADIESSTNIETTHYRDFNPQWNMLRTVRRGLVDGRLFCR